MKRLVRYGLLLLVLPLIGLALIAFTPAAVFAQQDAVEEDLTQAPNPELDPEYQAKKAAIRAADEAIAKLPNPDRVIADRDAHAHNVITALALVEYARIEHGAIDSDFQNIQKLKDSEARLYKYFAIRAAHEAIDALPEPVFVTNADREAVLEARRLVDYAMQVHGATDNEMCWRYQRLKRIERRIAQLKADPEPLPPYPPDPVPPPPPVDNGVPTPPTGGVVASLVAGALALGSGVYVIKRRQLLKRGKH